MLERHIIDQIRRSHKEPAATLFRGASKRRLKIFMDEVLEHYGIQRSEMNVDVHYFSILEGEKSLGVETAREIANILTRPPLRSPKRTILIEDADLLTMAASNALLKPLEELGQTGRHRVLVTATQTREWPSPLLSRFQIYELHTSPPPQDESFGAILRQGDPDLQDFWAIHEDALYEVLDIIWKILSYPSHEILKRFKEFKVVEEDPVRFLSGLILSLMHVDMYLKGHDAWRMAPHYKALADSYGDNFKTAKRQDLIGSLASIQEWCKRSGGMGSPSNHVLATILMSKYNV